MSTPRTIRATFLLLIAATCAPALANDVTAKIDGLRASYASQLADLADWSAERGLDEQAETLRNWLPTRQPDRIYVFSIDADGPIPRPEADSAAVAAWFERFTALRRDYAAALYNLVAQAAEDDRPELVMELLTEVIREDPDHAEARRVLGYVRTPHGWATEWEADAVKAGYQWHARFGWIRTDDVADYEAGRRRYAGRWIDAEQETKLRSDIRNGWKIRTAHYEVTTNHSVEAGVQLAARLERLRNAWRVVFAGFWMNTGQVRRILAGEVKTTLADSKVHRVVYYRSRDEYNAALIRVQPKIEMTLGFYLDTQSQAYFFAGDDQDAGTIYHEATHQLFQETPRRTTTRLGQDDNFWIVEGIAAYMESFEPHESYSTVGGANAGRMPAARHRLLVDGFYVPLAELSAMGRRDVQSHPRIASIYSQSAGLCTFFMHAGGGKYREPLGRYLRTVYLGRSNTMTLARSIHEPYESLDRAYRDFMAAE